MGITMIPDQFDQDRRHDPKRAAEARVFDALQNTGPGRVRHLRVPLPAGAAGRWTSPSGWTSWAGSPLQVKGGHYDAWTTPAGGHLRQAKTAGCDSGGSSPLSATVDGCMEMRRRDPRRPLTSTVPSSVGVLVSSRTC